MCIFFSFDISGNMASDIEPIKVLGIVIIGRAIPVITPNVATAVSIAEPVFVRKKGKAIDINMLTKLVKILSVARGMLSVNNGFVYL